MTGWKLRLVYSEICYPTIEAIFPGHDRLALWRGLRGHWIDSDVYVYYVQSVDAGVPVPFATADAAIAAFCDHWRRLEARAA